MSCLKWDGGKLGVSWGRDSQATDFTGLVRHEDSPRNTLKSSSDRASMLVSFPYPQLIHFLLLYQMPVYTTNTQALAA